MERLFVYDLIFPLFMFIAGVAIPFSFASHFAKGEGSARLHLRIIRRGIVLVLLGLVINGVLRFNFTLHFAQDASGHRSLVSDFSIIRFPSVLGRIGLAYLFAALIALHTRPRNQLLTAIGLLLGYWAALKLIPVPSFPTGVCSPARRSATTSIATSFPAICIRVSAIRRDFSPRFRPSPRCSSA